MAGFALWAWTLLLPSIAKSGWMATGFLTDGPFGIALLRPEQLLGLTGLDSLTHALLWSLLGNAGLYVAVSLARAPSAREATQALLFVDVFQRSVGAPVFWRGRARLAELQQLAVRFLGAEPAQRLFADYARRAGVADVERIAPDAQLVQHVETQLAGAIGSASARAVMASVVEEEPLAPEDILRMLDEASQVRALNRQLESLDRLKDDFMSSVTHELRTAADLDPRLRRADARRPRHGRRAAPSSSSAWSSARPSASAGWSTRCWTWRRSSPAMPSGATTRSTCAS